MYLNVATLECGTTSPMTIFTSLTPYIIREEIVGKWAREQEGGAERDF